MTLENSLKIMEKNSENQLETEWNNHGENSAENGFKRKWSLKSVLKNIAAKAIRLKTYLFFLSTVYSAEFNNCNIKDSVIGSRNITYKVQNFHTSNTFAEMTDSKKRPVDNVKQPTPKFIKTIAYNECKLIAQSNDVLIFHVHGFPGSGKSEIIRKLASDCNHFCEEVFAKWHIECGDSNHDIETELKELLKSLKESNIVHQSIKLASEALKKNQANPYVEILRNSGIPMLIIIEDPKPQANQLLSDFLRCINNVKSTTAPLHIYITSRKNSVAMPREDLLEMLTYKDYKVEGFTTEEGVQFLFAGKEHTEEERKAAVKIYDRLSGSPLGLIAVKATCRKSRLTFSKYLECVRHNELEPITHQRETKHLQEEYGSHVKHLFQSITLLLAPKENSDETSVVIWNVMMCLAFLHHGNLPQLLIARLTQMFREEVGNISVVSSQNEMQSGEFITNLEDFGICTVDGADFNRRTITFHEVVLHAVRIKLKNNPTQGSYLLGLKRAIFGLSGIVHKDLRKTEDNVRMNKLSPQIECVLNHIENEFSFCEDGTVSNDDFVLWMCVCHLYEVLGIVKSLGVLSLKEFSEKCLRSATHLVIKMICSLTNSAPNVHMLDSDDIGDVNDVASNVVSRCHEAGKKLAKEFTSETIDQYMSKVLQMKSEELRYLEGRAAHSKAVIDAKSRAEISVGLDPEAMLRLRNCGGIFLDRSTHCQVFFAERLASILHTWGRMILYYNITITPQMRQHFQWFSKLSHAISVECREQVDVKLLFEQLSSISYVPIVLKGLGKGEDRISVLRNAKATLQDMLDNERNVHRGIDFYEHGHVKKTGALYEKFILHRFMVRINARLVASESQSNPKFLEEADEVCETLYNLSVDNIDWIMAPKCLVYCGKYHAAKGEYQRAADCFYGALEAGIDQSMNLYAWACYNYVRAVVCGKVTKHSRSATARCRNLLKTPEDVDDDLVQKVTEQFEKLTPQNNRSRTKMFILYFIMIIYTYLRYFLSLFIGGSESFSIQNTLE